MSEKYTVMFSTSIVHVCIQVIKWRIETGSHGTSIIVSKLSIDNDSIIWHALQPKFLWMLNHIYHNVKENNLYSKSTI